MTFFRTLKNYQAWQCMWRHLGAEKYRTLFCDSGNPWQTPSIAKQIGYGLELDSEEAKFIKNRMDPINTNRM